MDTWLITIVFFVASIGLFYLFLIWNYGGWRKRGVPETKSYPGIGSFPSLFTQKRNFIYDLDEVYRNHRDSNNFVGAYSGRAPTLLILDPELVHRIHVNDFKYFHDNEFGDYVNEKSDIIAANNPFFLRGEMWKERRADLVPGMSPNKIKAIYPVTLEKCKRLTDFIRNHMKAKGKDGLECHELCLRYTTEVVSDCVLGINVGTLNDAPSTLLNMIKKLFTLTPSQIVYQIIIAFLPSLNKYWKATFFSKTSTKYFFDLMADSIKLRRQEQSNKNRADFLNFLLQLQEKKNLSTTILTANAMTFLTDGFLTTAQSISHCLLGLARNPETQEKLRAEIMENISEDGVINYDRLSEMSYLDACFNEALRLFPPVAVNSKLCTQPYEFVNKNGSSFRMEKGEAAFICYYSIHHDERYYDDPEDFKPERFLPENGGVKKYREQGKFMGFGDGPRICMGMRFGSTQAKAAIVEIIRNFYVKSNPKTRSDNLLDKKEFVPILDGGVWLDFEAINY
uniref:Cytochrome P450 n=2 Tax=Musca domestica TaxID=7370 RepID=A0A1I8M3K8_MUSDO